MNHKDNLRKLAHYLMSGKLKAKFDMIFFCDGNNNVNCGTIGCAAGHGPYAGIEKISVETWVQYITRVFGLDPVDIYTAEKWIWCFTFQWADYDNTPRGAGIRILYMLEKGVPKGFKQPDDDWDQWVEFYNNWWKVGADRE